MRARWQPGAAPSGVLPRGALVGREDEAALVHDRCVEHRLVSLLGAGGTGKTTLAAAVAPDVAGAVGATAWWIDLQPVPVDGEVAPVVGDVLGISGGGDDHGAVLAETLGDRPVLLVLDNCEHVVEPVAEMLDVLLPACGGVRALATSREVLGVVGEVPVRLSPLELPPQGVSLDAGVLERYAATALFLRRAGLAPDVLDEEQRRAVAAVCRHLDGLPLAIELAAARSPVLSPAQIETALADRFRLLLSRRRTVAGRQQTLEGSISWSYDLLDEDEQHLLRSLGVFPAGFDLAGAAIVGALDDEHAAADLLTGLVDKSLVAIQERASGRRFRLQESVRAFGDQQLGEHDELDAARDRHLEATRARLRSLQLAEDHEGLVLRGDAWMAEELDDVRAAGSWAVATGRPEQAVDLWWAVHIWANALGRSQGPWSGVEQTDTDLLDDTAMLRRDIMLTYGSADGAPGDLFIGHARRGERAVDDLWDGDKPDPARPLTALAARLALMLERSMGGDTDFDELAASAHTVLSFTQAHDEWGDFIHVVTAIVVDEVLWNAGQIRESYELAVEAAETARDLPRLRSACAFAAAVAAAVMGRASATDHLLESLEHTHPGWSHQRVEAVTFAGWLTAIATGDLSLLEELRAEHCQYPGAIGTRMWMHTIVLGALLALEHGDPDEALRQIDRTEQTAMRNLIDEIIYRRTRMVALARTGRLDESVREATTVDELTPSELRAPSSIGWAAALRSEVQLRVGDPDAALDTVADAASLLVDADANAMLALVAVRAAQAQTALGRTEDAARTLGVLAADLAARGAHLLPSWERDRATAQSRARKDLGDEGLGAAFAAAGALGWSDWVNWLTRGRGERMTDRPAGGWAALTDAEIEVATRAADGLSNTELAEALFISVNTVKSHVRNIYQKLDVHSRAELTRIVDDHT